MFLEKLKEAALSVLPIAFIVMLLSIFVVDVETDLLIRFYIGALFIIVGLAVFLVGAETGVGEIGSHLGSAIADLNSIAKVFIAGLFLGFIITIAEPDLMILADQIESVTSGALNKYVILLSVAGGVGLMLGIGYLRILLSKRMDMTFAFFYGLIFVLLAFVAEQFHGIAFDASGATTGAMTTPFILAVGMGVASMKGSSKGEDDSFGLLGMSSVGPILAVVILSFFTADVSSLEATQEAIEPGVFGPIVSQLGHSLQETAVAIMPVAILFLIVNAVKLKLRKREFIDITRGLVYAFVGLVIFLTGVNSGFMDLARVIGKQIATINKSLLPIIGFVFGMVIVLAEPAVYILSRNVEDVTTGHIPRKMILLALSIGVALAVMMSMLRIMHESLRLWMFLLPGFLIAVLLSFKIPPIFVGIAFDSGGVASGPMTATFLLAFSQGAAFSMPNADVLIDGFGVIAMVAMMPIIAISVLGLIFKIKAQKEGLDV